MAIAILCFANPQAAGPDLPRDAATERRLTKSKEKRKANKWRFSRK